MTYFIKRTPTCTRTFGKSGPLILRIDRRYFPVHNGQKFIFDKVEGADFKYDNSFFKFQFKSKTFLVPNSIFSLLTWNLAFWHARGCWFQIWQQFFQTSPWNTQIRQFWSWALRFFLHETLRFLKFEPVDSKRGISIL